MTVKEINRNIRFESRNPDSKYRCKYGDRDDFDIHRINITLEGVKRETYEIEAQNLPATKDSIYFNACPADDGFKVFWWTPEVRPVIRKIEV